MNRGRCCWGMVLLTVLACAGFGQQAYYGSIVGLVTDASDAVVPGAEVKVTNIRTGVEIQLNTNDQGLYQALNLAPGDYKVTVVSSGFQTFLRENIAVQPAQQVRVNAQLQVGDVTQVLEVASEASLINTENSTTTVS